MGTFCPAQPHDQIHQPDLGKLTLGQADCQLCISQADKYLFNTLKMLIPVIGEGHRIIQIHWATFQITNNHIPVERLLVHATTRKLSQYKEYKQLGVMNAEMSPALSGKGTWQYSLRMSNFLMNLAEPTWSIQSSIRGTSLQDIQILKTLILKTPTQHSLKAWHIVPLVRPPLEGAQTLPNRLTWLDRCPRE